MHIFGLENCLLRTTQSNHLQVPHPHYTVKMSYFELSISGLFPIPSLDKLGLVLDSEANPLVPPEPREVLRDPVQHAPLLGGDLGLTASTASGSTAFRTGRQVRSRRLTDTIDGTGGIVDGLGDADAHDVGGAAEQAPQEAGPCAGDGRGDSRRGIADADGEDLRVGGGGEQARAEGQDALAVGGCALGEDGDDAARVLGEQGLDRGQAVGGGLGAQLRGAQGVPDGAPQADLGDLAAAGVADGEDGVEDGGEVDCVDGAGEARCDEGGGRGGGHAAGGLLREGAALDAVELEVAPPDLGDGQEPPDQQLVEGLGQQGDVLGQDEVEGHVGDEEGQAEDEEGEVQQLGRGAGGRAVRDEGRDAGACGFESSQLSVLC